jgi:DNA methylase
MISGPPATDLNAVLAGFSGQSHQKMQNKTSTLRCGGHEVLVYASEFWTAGQRKASSIHEISYRACFKPQLPRFFINMMTRNGDTVYDPFSGRGTTVIEAGLCGRNIISNDANPLSEIMTRPRFFLPSPEAVKERLLEIPCDGRKAGLDLSMFYHPETEQEIIGLRTYLLRKRAQGTEDETDRWIGMVATNRLTGHSSGFFSVYTLPPNQAVSQESQTRINRRRRQVPEYRNTHRLIMKKTKSLLRTLDSSEVNALRYAGERARFLTCDARNAPDIADDTVQLTVTSPPFLDIVQYREDNWLRCWFNGLESDTIGRTITMARSVEKWAAVMKDVLSELYRITAPGGGVAFEVGEVRKGTIRLEEVIVPLGIGAGFSCPAVMINTQAFTKTSHIWGVDNMGCGTNTNRIVVFNKPL